MFRNTSRRARRRWAGAVAVTVALSVSALAATGSGASVTVQKKQPVDKEAVLRVGMSYANQGGLNFDPNNSTQVPEARSVWDLVYDTMIIWDPVTDELAPGLATKWDVSSDQKTITLTLREGVEFSDGSAFDAAAVEAAWEKHLACAQTASCPSTPPEVKAITSVEAPDAKTVKITLSQPIAKTVVHDHLTSSRYLAVPSPAAAAAGTLNQKPVGAGPYVVTSFTQGERYELARNPSYWNPKAQRLAGYELQALANGQPAITALQAGTVDLIWQFGPDALPTVDAIPDVVVEAEPGVRVNDVVLCGTDGVFTDKVVRQAMQYAFDRESINDGAYNGMGEPNATAVPASSAYFDKAFNRKALKQYAYNPKKAKKLLQEAGVAPGTTLQVMTSMQPPQPQMLDIVTQQLEDVGFNVEGATTSSLTGDVFRLVPDAILVGADPSLWSLAFEQSSFLNYCAYSNPEVSAQLAVLKDGTKSPAEQQAAVERFQEILLEDSPVIFTVTGPLFSAHTADVQGWDGVIWPSGPVLRTLYKTKG